MERIEVQPGYWIAKDSTIYSDRSGRLISVTQKKNGYLQAHLSSGYFHLHRLVAMAFVPGMTDERCQVNHKNGVKHDNRPENLEWVTAAENIKHAWQTGLMKHTPAMAEATSANAKKANRLKRKLTSAQADEIRNRVRSGEVQRRLAFEYGVSAMTISDLVRGVYYAD